MCHLRTLIFHKPIEILIIDDTLPGAELGVLLEECITHRVTRLAVMATVSNDCVDECHRVIPCFHHVNVSQTDHLVSARTQPQITMLVIVVLIDTCVVRGAIHLNNESVTYEKIDGSDAWNDDLLTKLDALGSKSLSHHGLDTGVGKPIGEQQGSACGLGHQTRNVSNLFGGHDATIDERVSNDFKLVGCAGLRGGSKCDVNRVDRARAVRRELTLQRHGFHSRMLSHTLGARGTHVDFAANIPGTAQLERSCAARDTTCGDGHSYSWICRKSETRKPAGADPLEIATRHCAVDVIVRYANRTQLPLRYDPEVLLE